MRELLCACVLAALTACVTPPPPDVTTLRAECERQGKVLKLTDAPNYTYHGECVPKDEQAK
ncbi:MAG TPA: hypothetical protein VH109_02720 [Steroidobacteraceae bacterium]|jgi:hypothetical protein|nr:hypothetical protein [Steroidobacteraceae bacterium]